MNPAPRLLSEGARIRWCQHRLRTRGRGLCVSTDFWSGTLPARSKAPRTTRMQRGTGQWRDRHGEPQGGSSPSGSPGRAAAASGKRCTVSARASSSWNLAQDSSSHEEGPVFRDTRTGRAPIHQRGQVLSRALLLEIPDGASKNSAYRQAALSTATATTNQRAAAGQRQRSAVQRRMQRASSGAPVPDPGPVHKGHRKSRAIPLLSRIQGWRVVLSPALTSREGLISAHRERNKILFKRS